MFRYLYVSGCELHANFYLFSLLDEICGVLLENAHKVLGDKECSIPLINIFPQVLYIKKLIDSLE